MKELKRNQLNYRNNIIKNSVFIKILVVFVPIELVQLILNEFFKTITTLKTSIKLVDVFLQKRSLPQLSALQLSQIFKKQNTTLTEIIRIFFYRMYSGTRIDSSHFIFRIMQIHHFKFMILVYPCHRSDYIFSRLYVIDFPAKINVDVVMDFKFIYNCIIGEFCIDLVDYRSNPRQTRYSENEGYSRDTSFFN
jgi:hypothetical protein